MKRKESIEVMSEKNKSKGSKVSSCAEKELSAKERTLGSEKTASFFVKERELKRAYISQKSLVLISFRENLFSTTDLDPNLSSVFVLLLQEFNDVFSK